MHSFSCRFFIVNFSQQQLQRRKSLEKPLFCFSNYIEFSYRFSTRQGYENVIHTLTANTYLSAVETSIFEVVQIIIGLISTKLKVLLQFMCFIKEGGFQTYSTKFPWSHHWSSSKLLLKLTHFGLILTTYCIMNTSSKLNLHTCLVMCSTTVFSLFATWETDCQPKTKTDRKTVIVCS